MERSDATDGHWTRWINDKDERAAEAIIAAYLPLVDYHVQRIGMTLPQNVDRNDLRSQGMIGLYDALMKFDHRRDLKFYTYASFRVRGAIIDSLRKEDWLPRASRERAKKIDEATESLEQEKGRHVTEQEVADALNISLAEVLKTTTESYMSHLLSMDQELDDENGEETHSLTFQDKRTPSPYEAFEKKRSKSNWKT